MKKKKLNQMLEDEAILLCPLKDKATVIDYELLLKDIVSLSLYLQHEDSKASKNAGAKMMSNLMGIFKNRPAIKTAIANVQGKAGEDYEADQALALSLCAHSEFNQLWGDHSKAPKKYK